MSSVTSLARFADSRATEPPEAPQAVVLRVSGGKPLHLHAELVAEATSWTPGAPAWHELAIYQKPGEWVVALASCSPGPGATPQTVSQARAFPNREAALGWLQEVDPTADLAVDIDASDRSVSTVTIALRAAALRQRADRVEHQYRAMLGELLYRLDLGE